MQTVKNRIQMFRNGLESMRYDGLELSWKWRFGPFIDWTTPTEASPAWFHFDEMGLGLGPLRLMWRDTD